MTTKNMSIKDEEAAVLAAIEGNAKQKTAIVDGIDEQLAALGKMMDAAEKAGLTEAAALIDRAYTMNSWGAEVSAEDSAVIDRLIEVYETAEFRSTEENEDFDKVLVAELKDEGLMDRTLLPDINPGGAGIGAALKKEEAAVMAAIEGVPKKAAVSQFGTLVVAPGRFVTTEKGEIVAQVPATSQHDNALFVPVDADRFAHTLAQMLSNQEYDISGRVPSEEKWISDEGLGAFGKKLAIEEQAVMAAIEGKTADYQGWKNYATWNVALWLDNDQGSQSMVQEWAQEAVAQAPKDENVGKGYWSVEDAVKYALADRIKQYVEEGNPLSGDASMYSDILGSALGDVDWGEVAEHYMEEGGEETPEPIKKEEASVEALIDGNEVTAQNDELKSTQNTPDIKAEVEGAFSESEYRDWIEKADVAYEHGQWWVTGLATEDSGHEVDEILSWSVVDAEGPGSIGGFDFEQV